MDVGKGDAAPEILWLMWCKECLDPRGEQLENMSTYYFKKLYF